MLAGSIMEGVSVMLAPLCAEQGVTVVEGGFALVSIRMTAAAGRAAPGDVDDLDDVCRA